MSTLTDIIGRYSQLVVKLCHCFSPGNSEEVPNPPSGSDTSPTTSPGSGSDVATSAIRPLYAGSAKTPLAVVATGAAVGGSSRRFKRRTTRKPPPSNPRMSGKRQPAFDLSDKQKVATVIQRIVGRMRSKLSSVRWTETDGRAGVIEESPPDITINMPIAPRGHTPGPEKGLKPTPGKRLVYIPPKLHDPPRGWAPASHNVPANMKTSWGKAKSQNMNSNNGFNGVS